MKLGNALAIVEDMRLALQAALLPTLRAVLHAPGLLVRPRALSRVFFARVWELFGDPTDENGGVVKREVLAGARGVVLDLGAGHGHTARYLDPGRVTRYVAVEPNAGMHARIRGAAAAAGFGGGAVTVLGCGAEDVRALVHALGGAERADTVVAVLTLCCVPRPAETVGRLVREVLRPGGTLLFFEHVASPRGDVLWWQRFWTPLWSRLFDGCELGRPTDKYIRGLGEVWEEFPGEDGEGRRTGVWGKEGESEEHLFWHQAGRLVKRMSN